ncbi:DUF4097 family beta strand repeat-containing protein [Streptomyces sp. SCA2-2]|uniref:hypothetical protein n=1 Tax=Streptomyces sp. SCA2-2 TaxID=1563677 RepID=UPI0010224630|nr:hypothetical protein [Streptomyces sp. SCA2-2]
MSTPPLRRLTTQPPLNCLSSAEPWRALLYLLSGAGLGAVTLLVLGVLIGLGLLLSVSNNGSVDSVGLTQSQEIESSNAAVKIEKASGDVSLKVRDGNTEAIGISAGQLTAETRNGRLKVVFTEPPRKVTASTDNGNVNVTLPLMRTVTRSGSMPRTAGRTPR